jgi:hypothetical protein
LPPDYNGMIAEPEVLRRIAMPADGLARCDEQDTPPLGIAKKFRSPLAFEKRFVY